jgi:PIN domain nuclease of toxin-antitoxin system
LNLLLDTHVLLWSALGDSRLPQEAGNLISRPENKLWFSAASLWEIAIKSGLGRPDFRIDAGALRAGLLANDYSELAVEGRHVLLLRHLPDLHRDPFDRILLAQANAEGLALVTSDRALGGYGGVVRMV